MAFGLCAALVVEGVVSGKASAQTDPAAGIHEAQASRAIAFDIPPQPLASALLLFGRQAGLQVVVDPPAVAGRSSAGLRGSMSADQALQQLLAGTGLSFQYTGNSSVQVRAAGAAPGAVILDPVQVQGFPVPQQAMIDNVPPPYAGGQVGTGSQLGLLGNRDVMNTPFNQTSYTAKKAQDQQAKTIRDVLVDDPSVRSTYTEGTAGQDQLSIRGFPVGPQNMAYGGLYGMLPDISVMMEVAERVELLKGPSAMLNGMPPNGAIGGTINLVPKRARDEDLTQITANYSSLGVFGGAADVGRRFGEDKQFGVRVNGAFRAGQTAIENNTDQRGLALIGLDFRGERVRLSADLGYQSQTIGGVVPYLYLGPAATVSLPWAPDARKNMGQSWGSRETTDIFGVVRAEYDITERVTAYAAFGAHDYRLGIYSSSTITINNFNGNGTAGPFFNSQQYFSHLTAETGVRAFADTGPIGHEIAVVATTYNRQGGVGSVIQGAGFATNIYNPTLVARPNVPAPNTTKTSALSLNSIAIADTLSAADKRIQLTAGLRIQQVQVTNYALGTGAVTTSYDQNAVTPSVALVFKPWENVSFYGNYIQGLQPGATVGPTFANAGTSFPPYLSTQFEVGVKVDWGKLTTTASLFQITQPSVITDVASNTQTLGGEQRNQGLELNFFGEVTEGFRVLGGAMFLNPVLTKTPGGLTDGWIAPSSPQVQLNLASEWDLPWVRGLTLSGRFIYTGAQFYDTLYPRRMIPEWTRVDFGVRYAFDNPAAKGKPLVARFNVENLLDNDYWSGGGSATSLMVGAPRTFRLSLTADF